MFERLGSLLLADTTRAVFGDGVTRDDFRQLAGRASIKTLQCSAPVCVATILNRSRRLRLVLFVTFLLTACHPLRGCSESQFKLNADSRLPARLMLPAGLERRDVDVELWYWTPIADVDNATVYVKDGNGRSVANLTGRSCWHPATHWPMGGPVAPEPHYVILIVGGVVDVAEHTGGDWKMSDNAEILAAARESVANGECRHSPDNY